MNRLLFAFLLFCGFFSACQLTPETPKSYVETKADLDPAERFGQLFVDVQMSEVFPDSKTFVDGVPKFPTDEILDRYEKQSVQPGFDLKLFVLEHFTFPAKEAMGASSDTVKSLESHILNLWPSLTRQALEEMTGTQLPTAGPHVVSTGSTLDFSYREGYFILLGLAAAEEWTLVQQMIDNYVGFIEQYGYVPEGNRIYHLGRSGPPFFSLMVELLAQKKGNQVFKKYLPQLKKEYAFWMDGADKLSVNNTAFRRVIRLANGSILNRYYDDQPAARPEAYREDIRLAKGVERPSDDLYRDIRAACESGWAFSSRWFGDEQYLASIQTTNIIPVDLNSLLVHTEQTLAKAYLEDGDEEQAEVFRQKSVIRAKAILDTHWDAQVGLFRDFDYAQQRRTNVASLAMMYPLYVDIARPGQADSIAMMLRTNFLKPGGVANTLNHTNQDWDAPFGMGSVHWVTIKGLRNYELSGLADTIQQRWINLNQKVFQNTGRVLEKYNVEDVSLFDGGGAYRGKDGYGPTNGVFLALQRDSIQIDSLK